MSSKILCTTRLFPKISRRCSRNATARSYSVTPNMDMKEIPKSNSTINEEEMKKFTNHIQNWWDLNGPMKALHAMNMLRVPFLRDGLVQCAPNERKPAPLQNLKILDIGCGGGILSEALVKLGADVTGIDPNKDLVELARQHSEINSQLPKKPTYCCTTIEEHKIDYKDYYDGIMASEVIEHVDNKELFVQSCTQALKPGGRIFFTTLNRNRLSQMFCIYFAEYILNLLPRGTHQYEMLITPNELTFLLERNNCHVEAVYGTMYNHLLNEWYFVNSQTLMYALQAQKLEVEK